MFALLKLGSLIGLVILFGLPSTSMAGVIDIECGTRVNKTNYKVENPRVRLSSSSRASSRPTDWSLKLNGRKLFIKTVETRGGRYHIDNYIFSVPTGSSVGGAAVSSYDFNVKNCGDNLASLTVKLGGGGKPTQYECSCGID